MAKQDSEEKPIIPPPEQEPEVNVTFSSPGTPTSSEGLQLHFRNDFRFQKRPDGHTREEVRAGRRAWPGTETPMRQPAATAPLLARQKPPRTPRKSLQTPTCRRHTAAGVSTP